jgi:hypothetical protein
MPLPCPESDDVLWRRADLRQRADNAEKAVACFILGIGQPLAVNPARRGRRREYVIANPNRAALFEVRLGISWAMHGVSALPLKFEC